MDFVVYYNWDKKQAEFKYIWAHPKGWEWKQNTTIGRELPEE